MLGYGKPLAPSSGFFQSKRSRGGEAVNAQSEEPGFEQLFPEEICRQAVAELNAWTSVIDIAAAARCVAARPLPSDSFERILILRFPNNDRLQAVLVKVFEWLFSTYCVPPLKLELAKQIEPCLTGEIAEFLLRARLSPNISIGGVESLRLPTGPGQAVDDRIAVFEDEPYLIEVVQAPLRALMSVLVQCSNTVEKMRQMRDAAMATSDKPPDIFHHPYADSRLPAILEALIYFCHALSLGPKWATEQSVDIGYRAVNIHCRPPVEERLVVVVREVAAKQLGELG